MSCYLVDHEHINVLVWAITQPNRFNDYVPSIYAFDPVDDNYRTLGRDDAQRVGDLLYGANVASVGARYGDLNHAPYEYRTPRRTDWDAIDIIKAIHGYDYQACEAPDWTDSAAYGLIDALRRQSCRNLPGYNEAAWEIKPDSIPLDARG